MLVLQWRSCDCSRQEGKLRVRTEHLEVCRHFRAGISINVHHLCQYASFRRSACITGVPGRSGEGTAGRRRGMLRIAELNTWRSARKHADPEPSRGDAATVRGYVIAACAWKPDARRVYMSAGTAKGCRCFMGSPMGANGVRPVGRAEAMVALTI